MRANRGFIVLMSWAVLILLPMAASAQARIDVPATIGQKVWITVDGGQTIKGKVLRLTPDSIEVESGSIAKADIRRVRKADSLSNGAGTGAAILGLLGGLMGAGADGLNQAFGGNSNGSFMLLGIGVGALSGAGIGAGLDALRLTTTYERPENGMSFAVRPIVSAAGKGLGVQVRW